MKTAGWTEDEVAAVRSFNPLLCYVMRKEPLQQLLLKLHAPMLFGMEENTLLKASILVLVCTRSQ